MRKLYAATLERAAALVGGENKLAALLATRPSVLARWVNGHEIPPLPVFLKAVDVITEHEVAALTSHATRR